MASAPSGVATPLASNGRQSVDNCLPSRTLNFYQAMRDFKQMFPTMDQEIIEAVLRANNGEVDATIDQLLTMSIDQDEPPPAKPPPIPEKKDLDPPPSYEQAMRASLIQQPETLHISDTDSSSDDDLLILNQKDTLDSDDFLLRAPSPPTTQAPPVPVSRSDSNNADVYNMSFRNECLPPIPKREEADTKNGRPDLIPRHCSGPELPPKRYKNRKPYRRWNPPLLGTLPDDFLRLDVSPKSRWGTDSNEHSSPSGPPVKRSVSPGQSIATKARNKTNFRSMSLNSGDISEKPKIQSRKTLMEATQTELSGDIIKRRMEENAIRRSSLPSNSDPSVAQQLEDERLALMLQNEMFLDELQQDEDFMKTLERDRMNATAFESVPSRLSDDEGVHQEYGQDNTNADQLVGQRQMDVADKHAEFRRQLAQMGQTSKGKFMAVARRFFRVRRKSPRHMLTKDSSAPSTMNLLDDFENEDVKEPIDDLPIFEPLPGADDMTNYRLKVQGGNQKTKKQHNTESEA